MSMTMEISVFLAYSFAVLMVYVFGRFMAVPLKVIACCLASSIAGGIVIILINYFGAVFGLFIPLNAITAAIAGILGLPGIIALLIFFL